MDFSIEHDVEHNIVVIRARGPQDVTHARAAVAEAMAVARPAYVSRFLFDVRNTEVVDSFMDSFSVMADLASVGFKPTDRIAVLFTIQAKKHEFSETVAVNRGWTIRYFREEAEALQWLTYTELPNEPGARDG